MIALEKPATKDSPEPSRDKRTIAILGGGASGALVATQLLRRIDEGDKVVLIHRNPSVCFGIAYGTSDLAHRLNVRGQGMSAFPDQPNHFVDWLAERQVGDTERLKEAFIARRIYGEYLQSVLDTATLESKGSLDVVVDEVVGLDRGGEQKLVALGSGKSIKATHAVLAIGHLGVKFPPILRPFQDHPRFIRTPWDNGLDRMSIGSENVLMIGTGLTMVDAVMCLRSRLNGGKIIVRSRHGLMPHPHRKGPKPEVTRIAFDPPTGIRSLARDLIRQGRAAGPNWRSVVDGCRSRTADWWKALSWEDRSRFMDHLTPFWDVHRHRVDDELYAVLKQMQIEDQLDVASGRAVGIEPLEDGFQVTFENRNGYKEVVEAGWIVNCTGPETNYAKAKLPLLETAVSAGLATYDPLGLGVIVDEEHQTAVASGVYAIGPLCRGCLWETIAIPEIRSQAETIAKSVMAVS